MSLDVFAMVQQLTAECARCGKKAINLCSCPCRQAYYCDVKCQQEHWPVHKSTCTKARKGRQPQAFCSYCGVASISLKACMCEAALYCSFDCQRKHYGVHGRTCSAAVPRFRKRRKKPTTLDGVVGEDAGGKADADAAGAAGEEGNPADAVETAEMGLQTDVSCEALLASIKAALAPTGAAAQSEHGSFSSPRANGGSGLDMVGSGELGDSSGTGGALGGEMAFRSKASRVFNPVGPDGSGFDAETDVDSSDARSSKRGGKGGSNPLSGP
jgi:hypothetical protein